MMKYIRVFLLLALLLTLPASAALADKAPACEALGSVKAAAHLSTHIYAYTDDIVYADARYVCIHAASSGQKRIYLPHMGRLRDALTGREYERYDHFTDFMMEKGETLLFEILPV